MKLGISFAPGIFQSAIAHISEGLQAAEVIMDGLWIWTRHLYEQKERFRMVLQTAWMLHVKCQKPHLKKLLIMGKYKLNKSSKTPMLGIPILLSWEEQNRCLYQIQLRTTATYSQQTIEWFARKPKTLPDPGVVKAPPHCQSTSSPCCECDHFSSLCSADGNVTAWPWDTPATALWPPRVLWCRPAGPQSGGSSQPLWLISAGTQLCSCS